MKKTRAILVILLVLAGLLWSCKKYKYPESTFKGDPAKPENCPFHGTITMYNVNGIDSLDLLDKYIDTSKYRSASPVHIRDCEFYYAIPQSKELIVSFGYGSGDMASISYTFSKDRKKINVSFGTGRGFYTKNLFISDDTKWDILRLSKDNNPFKLRTTLTNGNTYEIQIR